MIDLIKDGLLTKFVGGSSLDSNNIHPCFSVLFIKEYNCPASYIL